MKCRHCETSVSLPFIDLETSPPSNSYLVSESLLTPEKWYPLRVNVCRNCWLVQTEDYADFTDLFTSDYAYFSGFSSSWLIHSERYVKEMIQRFKLDSSSYVIEVAANDGYLLQYVLREGIACLGIEPTASTAHSAREKGIEIIERFFGIELADQLVSQGRQADLTVANNVLAHVPDINDFIKGFARLLKPNGVSTFEFPHLINMVKEGQFDTIYHEHFSYLSLTAVDSIFRSNGMTIYDVKELPTHGGSLRIFAQRSDSGIHPLSSAVTDMLDRELIAGVKTDAYYLRFQEKANRIKDDFIAFLIDAKREGKSVGAYGAAAKGCTLLNYAGIRRNLLPWVVDRNPAKCGKFLPGNRIPIVDESRIREEQPNFVIILPWNLCDEVMEQLAYIRNWGGQFVIAIPEIKVL